MTQSWFETSDRVQFWESLTDRFCAAFIAPLNEWCRQHGKRFTAHVKGEEHPLFHKLLSTQGGSLFVAGRMIARMNTVERAMKQPFPLFLVFGDYGTAGKTCFLGIWVATQEGWRQVPVLTPEVVEEKEAKMKNREEKKW